MAPGSAPHVLLVGPAHERALHVCKLLNRRGLSTERCDPDRSTHPDAVRPADLVVFVTDSDNPNAESDQLATLLNRARAGSAPTVLWGTPDNFKPPTGSLVECLRPDIGLDEVADRLAALARYAPLLKRMENELGQLQRLGRHLNRHFDGIDEELRLAGRLQRDFLPRSLPNLPPLRFAQLYRPAGWVSGDIFDVFQIDARRVGMFVADAMGHGTAAGLMTMFLRRALVPKEVQDGLEHIVPPAALMRRLHEGLTQQNLSHAQFVTAAYAVVEVPSLDICLARGGHPYPLHIDADGVIDELRCDGGLLGVVGLESEFDEHHSRLAPGDKLVLYTDGLEDTFMRERDMQTEQPDYTENLLRWAHLGAEPFVAAIDGHLDRQEGSLNPADDVTVVVLEVAR